MKGEEKKTYNILGHNVGLEQRELPPFGMPATDSYKEKKKDNTLLLLLSPEKQIKRGKVCKVSIALFIVNMSHLFINMFLMKQI